MFVRMRVRILRASAFMQTHRRERADSNEHKPRRESRNPTTRLGHKRSLTLQLSPFETTIARASSPRAAEMQRLLGCVRCRLAASSRSLEVVVGVLQAAAIRSPSPATQAPFYTPEGLTDGR